MADPFVRVEVVEVRLGDRVVGAVAMDPRLGVPVFEYDPTWLSDDPLDLAPLRLPPSPGPQTFPPLSTTSLRGLPGLVADSLPGAFADALTNAWLARRGVQPGQVTPVDRLAYIGTRGMGALTFHPQAGPADQRLATAVDLGRATETARRALRGSLEDDDALQHLLDISGSAGGARPKVLLATDGAGNFRSGQLDAPDGFEQLLLKLDIARGVASREPTGLGRLEYAYHLMALDAGLDMEPSHLVHQGPLAHFATRRFDRSADGRLHVQSLAAMAHLPPEHPGAHGYEQYLQVCRQLDLPDEQVATAFRQIVFNIAAANRDDHTKNLGFVLRDDRWHLAPSYDLTFPYDADGGWPVAHQMTVAGSPHGAGREVLLDLAERAKVTRSSATSVIDEVTAAVARWPEHADAAGVLVRHRDQVATQLAATALRA